MSRWYIIHAYSGFENKVKDSILSEAKRLGLEPHVESVEVPTEKVTEIRRGKKVTNDRKFFPGYVLAKLTMSDQVYHLVKNTPKVTGFLGPNGKPQAGGFGHDGLAHLVLEARISVDDVPARHCDP